MELKSWDDVEIGSKSDLLLGNGFSVNIDRDFSYTKLLSIASEKYTDEEKRMFKKFNTVNFEDILYNYKISAIVSKVYGQLGFKSDLVKSEKKVRSSLIRTVQNIHTPYNDINRLEILDKINKEFKKYKRIFTTNYDLIPYWAIMEDRKKFVDYFWNSGSYFDEFETDISSTKIAIYYLHGALHIFEDDGDTYKIISKGKALLEKVYSEIENGGMPLFISEGESSYKLSKIKSSDYLMFCLRKLRNSENDVVVFGHSFSEKFDQHIIDALKNGKRKTIAISIFPYIDDIEGITSKIKGLLPRHNIIFFDSTTHPLGSEELTPYIYE